MKTMATIAALTLSLVSRVLADEGWTAVFNGKNTDGWEQHGAGIFKVEDGCLVGTQTDGKGGDLFTKATWGDVEIRFTYKVGWPANSGLWFRDKGQFDILKHPGPVAFSGSLYAPGRIFAATNTVESLEKRDDWNEGRIFAKGDHIVLWLNGTKTADCREKIPATGRIGIQVHGGDGFKGMKIQFRRIEVRPLKAGDEP